MLGSEGFWSPEGADADGPVLSLQCSWGSVVLSCQHLPFPARQRENPRNISKILFFSNGKDGSWGIFAGVLQARSLCAGALRVATFLISPETPLSEP